MCLCCDIQSTVRIAADVGKIGIADLGSCVPIEHRIDGLGELGAARFVYTTGVNPALGPPITLCLLAGVLYFLEAELVFILATLEVLECDLGVALSVR